MTGPLPSGSFRLFSVVLSVFQSVFDHVHGLMFQAPDALVLNVQHVTLNDGSGQVSADRGKGGLNDETAAAGLLRKLGYNVAICRDRTKAHMLGHLRRVLRRFPRKSRVFALVVTGHGPGVGDALYDTDGKELPLRDVVAEVARHPNLAGKTIFIISQFCRGNEVQGWRGSTRITGTVDKRGKVTVNATFEDGTTYKYVRVQKHTGATEATGANSDTVSVTMEDGRVDDIVENATDRDIVVLHATSPGFYAYREVLIPELVKVLDRDSTVNDVVHKIGQRPLDYDENGLTLVMHPEVIYKEETLAKQLRLSPVAKENLVDPRH